jgi:uncharacterized membrane protein YoaK (UPF0700 family)
VTERTHHPSGPLGVAAALAASAGFVDAHIYVNVTPVFVANMSGNLIHLGILIGDGAWQTAVASALALAAFTGGVVLATVHHDRQVRRAQLVQPTFLLAVEALLLLGLTAWLILASVSYTDRPGPSAAIALVVAGTSMGLQAAALRRVGEISVATTYGTGAIVRVGEKLVLAARRADRTTSHRRRVVIGVLTLVLVSYVAGAVVATLSGGGAAILVLPSLVVGACAIASPPSCWIRHPTEIRPASETDPSARANESFDPS